MSEEQLRRLFGRLAHRPRDPVATLPPLLIADDGVTGRRTAIFKRLVMACRWHAAPRRGPLSPASWMGPLGGGRNSGPITLASDIRNSSLSSTFTPDKGFRPDVWKIMVNGPDAILSCLTSSPERTRPGRSPCDILAGQTTYLANYPANAPHHHGDVHPDRRVGAQRSGTDSTITNPAMWARPSPAAGGNSSTLPVQRRWGVHVGPRLRRAHGKQKLFSP